MTSKFGKSMALIFAIGLLQFNLIAGPTIMGKLRTRDNKPVSVNSNKATSGTTILSGSEIVCPEKVGATIDLGPLGRLDMAPSTDVTLSFDGAKIDVRLKAGYVILTTKKGILGTVTAACGAVVTDSSKLSSVVAKTDCSTGPEAAAAAGAAAGGIGAGAGGIGAAGAAGIAGAGAAVVGGAAVIKANSRGSSLSSDNPRNP